MRVVALVSGGKDSCFNMMQCAAAGHEIVALANLVPYNNSELDSYMYQSVGYEGAALLGEAMELPLYRNSTSGKSNCIDKYYEPQENDEVEDLYELLSNIKNEIEYDAISCGTILSDYQRIRVENVCCRLNLVCLAYLWQRDQVELLKEMKEYDIDAIIIKVAAMGLDPIRHLGRSLRLVEPHLLAMQEQYGLHVCGEGGEYETLTLDCPLFSSRIVIDESEIVLHSDDPIAPVGYLKLKKLHLEKKLPVLDLDNRLAKVPLKNSEDNVKELFRHDEEEEEIENGKEDGNDAIEEAEEAVEETDFGTRNQAKLIYTTLMDCDRLYNECVVSLGHSTNGWLWICGLKGDSEDPKQAMQEAMHKLKSSVLTSGVKLSDICFINMFIKDMSKYVELNAIYCETLSHTNPPSRACVQVPLPSNCPVLLEALIWIPQNSVPNGDVSISRNTLHVQGISHWAPANIGPYSQAVQIGDFIQLAGQIGLVPGNMTIIKGGIVPQCKLALRSLGRVLKTMDSNISIRDVVQGICYLTNKSDINKARKIWEENTNNSIVDYIVVSGLPKNALVEWQVWAHKHNNQFEYEETGRRIEDWSISIRRRWNYENNVAAIVCYISHLNDSNELSYPNQSSKNRNLNPPLTSSICWEALEYTLLKLQQGHETDTTCICNLRIFYPINYELPVTKLVDMLENFKNSFHLVYTIVPVCSLADSQTYLSICGIRNQ